MSEECIFCKIIKGEIPCSKVYEDDSTFAFLDIAPVNKGHVLVLPKVHSETVFDISEKDMCAVAKTIRKICKAVKEGTEADGINIVQNNHSAAGQIVPHVHFHIIPRKESDGLAHWPQGKYEEGEMDKYLKEILEKIE